MQYNYTTIKSEVRDILLKEKGANLSVLHFPVNNEKELKIALEIKRRTSKATHHCYAFRIGINGENYRANDDGEPSGSAGLPIYNQLLAHNLTNILVVIVRYYGGTKLGVSGLVKHTKKAPNILWNTQKLSPKN